LENSDDKAGTKRQMAGRNILETASKEKREEGEVEKVFEGLFLSG